MQVFWKVYLFFCLILTGAIILAPFVFPQEMESWGSFDYIQVGLWLAGIFGLYGFAYGRGFGRVVYWKILFLLIVAVDVIYPTVFLIDEWSAVIEETSGEFVYFIILGWVFVVPFYIALYLYGWRSAALWGRSA